MRKTCPKCGSANTGHSRKGERVCYACGLSAEPDQWNNFTSPTGTNPEAVRAEHLPRSETLEGLGRGARIKKLCELSGVHQYEMARLLDVHEATVSRWVKEHYQPDWEQYRRMYRLFKAQLPWLTAEEMLGW